ncbi:MAG: tetratricopeptide repeat protein [Acidobacteria bacterium]|nr:tetratricopeptide repeat protein [Acidobacteriota bacterium]MBS1866133.1 tetratricopeptide repeat protein [Acidobacteriota bacterium]
MRFHALFIAILFPSPLLLVASGPGFVPSHIADAKPQVEEAALAKARELTEKSEFDEAETLTREFIAKNPSGAAGHFLLGLIYFRQVQSQARSGGIYSAPGEVPSRAVNEEMRSAKIRASLAEFTEGAKFARPSAFDLKIVALDYILLGDYPSADKWLTLAVQEEPSDAESWYYLGRTKYGENRFEEAIQAFQKSLELRPRNVLAGDGLGLSFAGLNRSAEAISAFQDAISWQSGAAATQSPEPFIDLGDFLNQQGRFEEALPVLQQAVAIGPRNIRAHEILGRTLLNLDRLADAQHELEIAVSADADRAALHYLLSQIYRKQGQMEKARKEMRRFQELKAKEPSSKSGMR